MNTPSEKSAVYAAGLVFAPSEELTGTQFASPPRKSARRSKQRLSSVYDVKFVKAGSKDTSSESTWRNLFDFSWLVGRATA